MWNRTKAFVTLFILHTSISSADTYTYEPYQYDYPACGYVGEDEECCCADSPPNLCRPHTISLGPEVYYAKRSRNGGTKQHGTPVGVRLTYDYIKRYCFYVGGQAFYGTGTLDGHTGSGSKIRSRLTDAQIEGSVGYTLQMKCSPYFAFTPYIGYGYFQEINKFTPPSPLIVKYTIQYNYLAFGFLSSVTINPCFTAGLNARFRSPWETHCKVTDDPDFENFRQKVGDRIQFRIELPLTYTGDLLCNWLQISLVPFYERRLYGERENYPFDFFKTTFNIYGANLQFILRF